jgi:hypothetical protein
MVKALLSRGRRSSAAAGPHCPRPLTHCPPPPRARPACRPGSAPPPPLAAAPWAPCRRRRRRRRPRPRTATRGRAWRGRRPPTTATALVRRAPLRAGRAQGKGWGMGGGRGPRGTGARAHAPSAPALPARTEGVEHGQRRVHRPAPRERGARGTQRVRAPWSAAGASPLAPTRARPRAARPKRATHTGAGAATDAAPVPAADPLPPRPSVASAASTCASARPRAACSWRAKRAPAATHIGRPPCTSSRTRRSHVIRKRRT